MHIRCLGSRGGLPVSGPDFTKYGGDTTCIEIIAKSGDVIIIDAGSGIRTLNGKSSNNSTHNLLFTHSHLDHLMGFPFFAPLYKEQNIINIYGYPTCLGGYSQVLKMLMTDPYFPAEFSTLPSNISFCDLDMSPFSIGSVHITSVYLNHPNGGLGYRFEEQGKSFVFLTDNELNHHHPGGGELDTYADFSKDADLLIHDAEFCQNEHTIFKGWGHSYYIDAVDLALEANAAKLGLFHINARRTDEQMDRIEEKAQQYIKNEDSSLDCFAVGTGFEMEL